MFRPLFLSTLLTAILTANAPAADPKQIATDFLADMTSGRAAEAEARLTPEMLKALGPGGTAALAQQLKGCAPGPIDLVKPVQTFQIVEFPLGCSVALQTARVTIDASGKVAGFFMVPRAASVPGTTESPWTIGQDPWILPGTLILPTGDSRVPVVLLLGGSGPTDRDSTIGPNKPLRDIANGLAAKGIGTLRFDKRPLVHSAAMARDKGATINQEYVEDAVFAIRQLRNSDRVDTGKIFVLGHSLGGVALPRIATAEPSIAGLIYAAAPAEPITTSLPRQILYISNLDGAISPEEQQTIDTITGQVSTITVLQRGGQIPEGPLLGAWGAHWLDMAAYDYIGMATTLPQPALFLQGGRDYQVLPAEASAWKSRFDAAKKAATWKYYPNLNHLFMPGQGTPAPAEYATPGSVSPEVIDEIARFVLAK